MTHIKVKDCALVCPETPVRNYHYSLRDDPEEHSSLRHYEIFVFVFHSFPMFKIQCFFQHSVLEYAYYDTKYLCLFSWRLLELQILECCFSFPVLVLCIVSKTV